MVRYVSYLSAYLFVFISGASEMLAQDRALPPTADSLLKEVITKYRTAETYSDIGSCTSGSNWTKEKPKGPWAVFKIQFARPTSLRFDLIFKDERKITIMGKRQIWWSDDHANHTWSSDANELEKLAGDDLYRSRWRVGTPAYPIPALLHERYANRIFPRIQALPPLVLAADEAIDGTECYHLILKNGAAMPDRSYDLWIGKNDLLIRKFAFRHDDFWHEEVHQDIQLNVDLPDETFRIAPPKSNESL
jgi:outer membrane lipoprotein-sorting protein